MDGIVGGVGVWRVRSGVAGAAPSHAAGVRPEGDEQKVHPAHQDTDPGDQTHAMRVYPHDGPIRHTKCGYILTTDHSDARNAGISSRRTDQTQATRVYPHDGPIRHTKCGYILTTDHSDAGSAGIFSRRTTQTQDARWLTGSPRDAGEARGAHTRGGGLTLPPAPCQDLQ
eukprot:7072723-Pyramimonas_sp.AAC.1